MAQESTRIKERQNTELKEPNQYKVIIFNDDFTTMEFVVKLLENVFLKTHANAEQLMLKVHNSGKAVVGIYDYDTAVSRVTIATQMARQNGYPLKLIYTPA